MNIAASGYTLSRTCATTSLNLRQALISTSRWDTAALGQLVVLRAPIVVRRHPMKP